MKIDEILLVFEFDNVLPINIQKIIDSSKCEKYILTNVGDYVGSQLSKNLGRKIQTDLTPEKFKNNALERLSIYDKINKVTILFESSNMLYDLKQRETAYKVITEVLYEKRFFNIHIITNKRSIGEINKLALLKEFNLTFEEINYYN